MKPIDQAQETYNKEVEKLLGYIQKSYKARIKWAKGGNPLKAIEAELSIAISGGRMDLVANLMERRDRLIQIEREIQRLDYEQRFGSIDAAPLPEDSSIVLEMDSTPFSTEEGEEVAENLNQ